MSVKIIRDRDEKPKGFGYIEFADLEGLTNALSKSGSVCGLSTLQPTAKTHTVLYQSFSHRAIRVNVAEPRECHICRFMSIILTSILKPKSEWVEDSDQEETMTSFLETGGATALFLIHSLNVQKAIGAALKDPQIPVYLSRIRIGVVIGRLQSSLQNKKDQEALVGRFPASDLRKDQPG